VKLTADSYESRMSTQPDDFPALPPRLVNGPVGGGGSCLRVAELAARQRTAPIQPMSSGV